MRVGDPGLARTGPSPGSPDVAAAEGRWRDGFVGRVAAEFPVINGAPVDTVRVRGGTLDGSLGLSGALLSDTSVIPARLTVDLSTVGRAGHGLAEHAARFAGRRTLNALLIGFYDAALLSEFAAAEPMLNAVDSLCNRLAAVMQEAILVHGVARDAAGGVVAVSWSAMAWSDAAAAGPTRGAGA